MCLQTDDGEDDLKKGTQLLEIYALEIQMYTAQKNNKKLKALYEQSLHIKSAIPHPLIMGVIRGELAHMFPWRMLRLRDCAWRVSYFSPQSVAAKCTCERVSLRKLTRTSLRPSKTTTSLEAREEQRAWSTWS